MNFNAYLGLDVHKDTIAVAIADGRTSDVRFYGGISNTPDAVAATLKRIAQRYGKLHVV
jgi:transposase